MAADQEAMDRMGTPTVSPRRWAEEEEEVLERQRTNPVELVESPGTQTRDRTVHNKSSRSRE